MKYLEEQAIDHDQVANSEVALGNALSSQHHRRCKGPTENDILPQIQGRQAVLSLQCCSLPVCIMNTQAHLPSIQSGLSAAGGISNIPLIH